MKCFLVYERYILFNITYHIFQSYVIITHKLDYYMQSTFCAFSCFCGQHGMVPRFSPLYFKGLCFTILKRASPAYNTTVYRYEKEVFGVSSLVCYSIWESIYEKLPYSSKPKHLLWALIFLKNYSTEKVHSIIAGCDVKTFRKWSWEYVGYIACLKTVRLSYIISYFF